MFRIVAPLLLLLALVLSGCDEGNGSDTAATESGDEASATPTEEEPSDEQSSSGDTTESAPEPVNTKAFCNGIHSILTSNTGEKRGQAALELLSHGLPADMSEQARDGLQVIVDLSPYFANAEELFQSYYALGEKDKESVHAFAGYVTTECGRVLVKDLMPTLPKDLVSELPSELASLLPKR